MRVLLCIFVSILFFGCGRSDKTEVVEGKKTYNGIPSTAYSACENDDYIVFLNEEAKEDSIEGLPAIRQVSLWTYNKKTKSGKKVLLSHPDIGGCWYFSMKDAIRVPLDSIPTINRVTILSWPDEPLKLLVEGCHDYRNMYSYIIDADSAEALLLPTNSGMVGISTEDGLLIMQSYAYYDEGGRYNVIEAFDDKGNRVSSMEAKIQK